MAEAAATPQTRGFYCHRCECKIQPDLSDLVCPKCKTDFIEEVTENSSLLQNTSESRLREMVSETLYFAECVLLTSISDSDSDSEVEESAGQSVPSSASHVTAERRVRDSAPSSEVSRSPWPGFLLRYWVDYFHSHPRCTSGVLAVLRQLHSNPGDYEWGLGDCDAIITRIFGQIENPGPPPAKEEDISSLPTVDVPQEQTDTQLLCAVCMEEYNVRECVMKLPCLHYFHKACVLPWLYLHDSCPVCRQSLSGNDGNFPHTPVPPEERSDSQDPGAAEEAGDVRNEPTEP